MNHHLLHRDAAFFPDAKWIPRPSPWFPDAPLFWIIDRSIRAHAPNTKDTSTNPAPYVRVAGPPGKRERGRPPILEPISGPDDLFDRFLG
ncbi:hypothetical protein N7492_006155 [Penicillium capsulatum]|uniref:Uncharacterized protein n=1 Tax=Penicillium capsulatum TaxID=69766 RepID=A0A9W9I3K2_9EURO|nr:hypothetical protein N7492_006155 [Penicillium capsulatum]KAJ6108806.1 hypothetical protein N7512_008643 [Penicillium capsulatum]